LAARAIVCPSAAESPAALQEARARLLSADSPAAAADLIEDRGGAADLRGIARLVALDRPAPALSLPEEELVAALDDPLGTPVSPVDDRVLALVVAAGARRLERTATHTARIKANALLARTYDEALLQLGLAPRTSLPPLARVLAGRFLHYGRDFVRAQRRRRVPGLDDLSDAIERRLLEVLLAVEATPFTGDDALLMAERAACRRFLQGAAVSRRLSAEGAPLPEELLAPWTNELDRLIEIGFVDQAIELAVGYSRTVGSDRTEAALLSALQARRRDDGRRRAVERFNDLREQDSPPPREGEQTLPGRTPRGWPAAAEVIAPIFARLTSPVPRRQALAEAILALRGRPDAAMQALTQLAPETAQSTESRRSDLVAELDWLVAEIEAAAPITGASLELTVAASRIRTPPSKDAAERSLRRRFALAAAQSQARDDATAAEQLLANRPRALELDGDTDTDTDTDTSGP